MRGWKCSPWHGLPKQLSFGGAIRGFHPRDGHTLDDTCHAVEHFHPLIEELLRQLVWRPSPYRPP